MIICRTKLVIDTPNISNLYLILYDWSGSARSAMSNIEFTAPLDVNRCWSTKEIHDCIISVDENNIFTYKTISNAFLFLSLTNIDD